MSSPSSWFAEEVCRQFKNGKSFAEIDRTLVETRDAAIRRAVIEEAKRRINEAIDDQLAAENSEDEDLGLRAARVRALAALDAMLEEK